MATSVEIFEQLKSLYEEFEDNHNKFVEKNNKS